MTALDARPFREGIFHIAALFQGHLDARDHPKALTGLLALKRAADQRAAGDLAGFLAHAPVWDEIRTAESPGEALTAAYVRLEEAHPGTERWFDDLTFSRKKDDLWSEVIAIVSGFSLGDADPEAFSGMLLQFYREGAGWPGSFETPPPLARLLASLLAPKGGASIVDPFCQDGAVLVAAARYAREHGTPGVTLYAQTPTEYTGLAVALTFLVHNCPDAHIATGDALLAPGFVEGRRLAAFDGVVGIIPAGAADWGSEALQPDPYLRFIYGVPPRTSRDYAYLSHALASLGDGGRLVAVVPTGVLFRSAKTERAIRTAIVSDDRVEAVIALPQRTVAPVPVEYALLVIAAGKAAGWQGRTIFIDASRPFQPGRGRNTLRDEDIAAVKEAYVGFKEVEGFSAVATTDEIAAQDFTLEVSRYVLPVQESAGTVDLGAAIAELEEIRKRKADALDRFLASIAHLEHERR